MSLFSLSGKTALVAGASTTPASRSLDTVREQAQALQDQGCQAGALRLDMTDSESIRAPLAVFLAGRGADSITGQIVAVDGGYHTTAVWPFQPEG